MRALLAIVIAAALGWSGWWWFNASTRERALTRWLTERQADGWEAEAADIRVTGFPNRVDTIVTDLRLADPEAGWSWQAEAFQVLSLAYRPHQFIAVLPGQQVVATPYQTVTGSSDTLRGSVAFQPNPRLELDRATFEIGGMRLASDLGWTATIGEAILATRQHAGTPFAHDVAFNAEDLTLPLALAGGEVLPETIAKVSIDSTLAFDRAWDRASVEGDNPVLEGVEVRDLTVSWGELDLRGGGTLVADADGYAEGRIDLRARNWRATLDAAADGGLLDPAIAGAVRAGLGLIARLNGDGETLNVPLEFEDGRARLGPIPIGAAPVLARRG